jgi:hypothetical protein
MKLVNETMLILRPSVEKRRKFGENPAPLKMLAS